MLDEPEALARELDQFLTTRHLTDARDRAGDCVTGRDGTASSYRSAMFVADRGSRTGIPGIP